MTERQARRLAWSAFGLWVLFLLAAIAFDLATKPMPGQGAESDVLFPLTTGAFPIASILILSRQPRNVIGWILMAIGLGWALPLGNYGDFAVSRHLPGGFIAVSLSSPTWAPPIVLMGTSLRFASPTARCSRRGGGRWNGSLPSRWSQPWSPSCLRRGSSPTPAMQTLRTLWGSRR